MRDKASVYEFEGKLCLVQLQRRIKNSKEYSLLILGHPANWVWNDQTTMVSFNKYIHEWDKEEG